MRPLHRFFSVLSILSLVLVCGGAFSVAVAEEDSFDSFDDNLLETVNTAHHPSFFAISAYAQHLIPIHILKEELYDINDLTGGGFGVGGELRIHILDELSLSLGFVRGGMGLLDSKMEEMLLINAKNLDNYNITPDAYIRLDGFYLSSNSYLGNSMMPGSKFNPYLRGSLMYLDWDLQNDGRGSNIMSWQEKQLAGTDIGLGFGIGTEYDIRPNLKLDWSSTWTYVATGDEIKWNMFQHGENSDHSYMWTNTHFWNMNFGLVYGF
jgi:hypothetical protein